MGRPKKTGLRVADYPHVGVRFSPEDFADMQRIATKANLGLRAMGLPPTATVSSLVRGWVMQRLDIVRGKSWTLDTSEDWKAFWTLMGLEDRPKVGTVGETARALGHEGPLPTEGPVGRSEVRAKSGRAVATKVATKRGRKS